MANDIAALKADNEQLKAANESLVSEKWELNNTNNVYKKRLEQSMAMTLLQVISLFSQL